MAMPTANPVVAPSAHVVGSAFVDQYYHILHATPELVYRFYQDSSVLTRPDANGAMISVTTMQAINDLIMSLDYQNYKAEIKSADAQESHKDGVMVLVTGCLTGKDHMHKKFAQSFFLAPQDKGYFVLNDVFRYVEENEQVQINSGSTVDGTTESGESVNVPMDPEPTHVSENLVYENPVIEPATLFAKEGPDNVEEIRNPSDNKEESVANVVEVVPASDNKEESVANVVEVVPEPVAHSSQNEAHSITEAVPVVEEDAPKKSYASILKVMKGDRRPTPVYVPTNKARDLSGNTERQSAGSAAPAAVPEELAPSTNNSTATSDAQEEVEGYSVYIRNLPMNATVAEVEEEFKKFGQIKPGGVQVRSNKGYCFGFVEFEALSSMQSAIEASYVTIGGRQAYIEQKRTTARVVSGRVRFPPNRSGGRSDSFRGRGNFGGGRGFGRSEFGNRGEFSGRGRGSSGRSGDGYEWVNGRGGRQGGGRPEQ